MAEAHNIVRVSGVAKTFSMGAQVVTALRGVDLTIKVGEYLSIMGPSGSGKSTLFNMIGGLDKPSSGKVFIDEVDIAQLDAYELAWLRNRKIGYIFQTFNLIQVMTALENVTLPMLFKRVRLLFSGLILGDFLMGGVFALIGLWTGQSYLVLPN